MSEFREKLRAILEVEPPFITGRLEQLEALFQSELEKAKKDYALKGATATLEDVTDWLKNGKYTQSEIQHHVSNMTGRVELKKLTLESQKERIEK